MVLSKLLNLAFFHKIKFPIGDARDFFFFVVVTFGGVSFEEVNSEEVVPATLFGDR